MPCNDRRSGNRVCSDLEQVQQPCVPMWLWRDKLRRQSNHVRVQRRHDNRRYCNGDVCCHFLAWTAQPVCPGKNRSGGAQPGHGGGDQGILVLRLAREGQAASDLVGHESDTTALAAARLPAASEDCGANELTSSPP